MKLSKIAQNLKPSTIAAVFDLASALRATGQDIVDFSVGEPDFDTPEHIALAGKAAIDAGHTRYTSVDGTAALKDAVLRKFSRENGLEFTRDEIVIGSGAKPILATAIAAMVGSGDDVIIPTPAWPSHLGMVEVVGATPVLVECGRDTDYKLTPANLRNAITPNTRMLILCSPSNPTGAVYDADELRALADVLRDYPEIAVISDDLYEHIVFDGRKFVNLAMVAPDLRDRILNVNGVSKAYAMTGWRIGYAAGPRLWTRAIAGIFTQTEGSPCAISQMAAIAALDGEQGFLNDWRAVYQNRRDAMLALLNESKVLDAYSSAGAFYIYVGFDAAIGLHAPDGTVMNDDGDVAKYLMRSGVAVTPASAFAGRDAMRISIATSDAMIVKGARRIVDAMSTLVPI